MQFSLIVVGDEILHGDRADAHFPFFKNLLREHGFLLRSVMYLPDERDFLAQGLRESFLQSDPVFVTGGIGGTPDDHTRQAAAQALDVACIPQPEAVALLEAISHARGQSLDSEAHRARLNMAEFPQGAAIIPNAYNGVAGFSIHQHYFLPGFPVMAHPMAKWVLEAYYSAFFHQAQYAERSIWVSRLPESAITPLMQRLEAQYAGVKTFSLPHAVKTGYVLQFGLKAQNKAVATIENAWTDALRALHDLGGDLSPTPPFASSPSAS